MADVLWRRADCQTCTLRVPTFLIANWGFDKDGTLYLLGVCRFCCKQTTITHTREEQEADIRQAFNQWKGEGGEEASDFKWWEQHNGGMDNGYL